MTRRSFWAWGLESDEPTSQQRKDMAVAMSRKYGVPLESPRAPTVDRLDLRVPRVTPIPELAEICSTDSHDRALHSYGRSFRDRVRAFNCDFSNPIDIVAYPRNEQEVEAVLEWCSRAGITAIPYGGGSSVVGGIEPPQDANGTVSIDISGLDKVLEIDEVSRAARIQGGVFGPSLENQLRPHGFTLRHFPQSYEFSSLGGWIATRSGGHFATNHTHIDDFVESVRMITPAGVNESRRLPGSGAGPSPDRLAIGSEGILGIITEAWMRIQARPIYRASAGVTFPDFQSGADAARHIVQAKLWPANCRVLDPVEAGGAAGLDGCQSLLVLGFESAEVPQDNMLNAAIVIARKMGGVVEEEVIKITDSRTVPGGSEAGRQGAVGNWRDSFVTAPYTRNISMGLGIVAETLETAVTWERWPELDEAVRGALQDGLNRLCSGGTISCRFTHVYPDGPAPYYTFEGLAGRGAEIEVCDELKHMASEALIASGGTITHHHAVGRVHRTWYDRQMPGLFKQSLKAVKRVMDPNGVMNPGVLIDP